MDLLGPAPGPTGPHSWSLFARPVDTSPDMQMFCTTKHATAKIVNTCVAFLLDSQQFETTGSSKNTMLHRNNNLSCLLFGSVLFVQRVQILPENVSLLQPFCKRLWACQTTCGNKSRSTHPFAKFTHECNGNGPTPHRESRIHTRRLVLGIMICIQF